MSTVWRDPSAFCPRCGIQDHRYNRIPESRRIVEEPGKTSTDYFPACRDYECQNCGAEWVLLPQDEDSTND